MKIKNRTFTSTGSTFSEINFIKMKIIWVMHKHDVLTHRTKKTLG